jgi:hypothetical protein
MPDKGNMLRLRVWGSRIIQAREHKRKILSADTVFHDALGVRNTEDTLTGYVEV